MNNKCEQLLSAGLLYYFSQCCYSKTYYCALKHNWQITEAGSIGASEEKDIFLDAGRQEEGRDRRTGQMKDDREGKGKRKGRESEKG